MDIGEPSGSQVIIAKVLLWILTAVTATVLIRRRKMSAKLRFIMLGSGVMIFGMLFGFLSAGRGNPDPLLALRGVLSGLLGEGHFQLSVMVLILLLVILGWISNKSVCGWGCQLGLLQDVVHRVALARWKPPLWLSMTTRSLFTTGLILGFLIVGRDLMATFDPFGLFRLPMVFWSAAAGAAVIIAGLFVYRPWCQLLCPFGLVSWAAEQISLLRPRINRDRCTDCGACIRNCPTSAMEAIQAGRILHQDCYSCGSCVRVCSRYQAVSWGGRISR
jgi:polyferredoxin